MSFNFDKTTSANLHFSQQHLPLSSRLRTIRHSHSSWFLYFSVLQQCRTKSITILKHTLGCLLLFWQKKEVLAHNIYPSHVSCKGLSCPAGSLSGRLFILTPSRFGRTTVACQTLRSYSLFLCYGVCRGSAFFSPRPLKRRCSIYWGGDLHHYRGFSYCLAKGQEPKSHEVTRSREGGRESGQREREKKEELGVKRWGYMRGNTNSQIK